MDSVLKEEGNSPAATNAPTHPYNTRSKDKIDVHNVDPEATIHLIKEYSKKEGQSEAQFISKQLEHHGSWEHKRQQEEAARRQDNQHRPPGKFFDMYEVDVDMQKRFYEEAQRRSKLRYSMLEVDVDEQKRLYEEAQHKSKLWYSSVDPAGYKQNVVQQEFHGPQIPQYQSQQPGYYQGPNVDHSGYGYSSRQHQLHNSQVPLQQSQQSGYHQDIPHHQGQSSSQLPYPHPDRAAQMAHIPRADGTGDNNYFPQPDPAVQMAHIPRAGDNFPHYYQPSGMPYNHNDNTRHGPHLQVQHPYEPMPGPFYHHDPYNQQHQNPDNINPYKIEEGSMILFGDPPCSGMVKWVGYLPDANVLLAGVEMVRKYMYI